MSEAWTSLPPGELTDTAIREASGTLFESGFVDENVEQSCYEFTVGDQYIDLSMCEHDRTVDLEETDYLLIRPRCSVVVKLAQRISIPNDCVARFLLKGKFFSVGIAPVNTYADAGFRGHMGIVLTNVTHFYIRIPRGERIVKAEFIKLPSPVRNPYAGQHGFGTGHWPILQTYRAKSDDLKSKNVASGSHQELTLAYGATFAETVARLRYYSVVVWIQLAIVVLGILSVLYFADEISAFLALGLGIGGAVLVNIGGAALRPLLPSRWKGEF